ncbi:MAG: MerR family transcriptional regulator [Ardenticatenia bacterium]|nr:MerR family transcriptional regulator [Ardenticatenia bacterium]
MKRIGQVSVELDISPQTIRQWTERFAPFLSQAATQAHRYSDEDVAILRRIRELHARGVEAEEIERHLQWRHDEEVEEGFVLARAEDDETAVSDPNGTTSVAIVHLLEHLDENQQTLLSTQLAMRDLLGLIVQDNIALKEENARLRKRLRVLEREVARLKEEDWNQRLSLKEQLNALRRELERHKPWWKRLFG